MDYNEMQARGLVREMARLYHAPETSRYILSQAGLPEEYIPPFNIAPMVYWDNMCRELDKGRVADLTALLLAAWKEFPGNPLLKALFTEVKEQVRKTSSAAGGFDVFLAHNSKDKEAVTTLALRLKSQCQLNPWLDQWHLPPGRVVHQEIEEMLPGIRAIAMFIGPSGMGPWQKLEYAMSLQLFIRGNKPIIPVILPGASAIDLPLSMQGIKWVSFSQGLNDSQALEELCWGIRAARTSAG